MDANIVVAICATIIAVASLAVSVYEGRATRRHYRLSVRPLLHLAVSFHTGGTAGLRLVNLGPAAITKTVLTVGPELLGEFNESNVNKVRAELRSGTHATTFGGGGFLATEYDQYLLSIEDYDPEGDAEFVDLLRHQLSLEIHYQSLYGGETYAAVLKPRADQSQADSTATPEAVAPDAEA